MKLNIRSGGGEWKECKNEVRNTTDLIYLVIKLLNKRLWWFGEQGREGGIKGGWFWRLDEYYRRIRRLNMFVVIQGSEIF